MKRPVEVPYMEKIQLVLDLFKKSNIPFEIINVQREDGSVEAAGIMFKDCRWSGGKLVESKKGDKTLP